MFSDEAPIREKMQTGVQTRSSRAPVLERVGRDEVVRVVHHGDEEAAKGARNVGDRLGQWSS